MEEPKTNIFSGTGSLSWLFYIALFGVFLYFFLPKEHPGMVGVLAAMFTAFKLESNTLKLRIRRLEQLIQ